jgi:diacylglycerol kinase (ATP)
MASENKGITRALKAAVYSWKGLYAAFKFESAFRQELGLALLLTPLGIYLGEDNLERALLVGSILLVLIVELLNSAIEAAVDRVSTEQHELAGRAKDLGSAAVFIALVNVVCVWVLLLI